MCSPFPRRRRTRRPHHPRRRPCRSRDRDQTKREAFYPGIFSINQKTVINLPGGQGDTVILG